MEVWQMKNASLTKQIDESTARLEQAVQNHERAVSRCQQLHTKVESEDAKKQEEQQQHMQHESQIEERQLRSDIQSLLDARRREARSAESTMRERARRLEDLRKQQADLWQHTIAGAFSSGNFKTISSNLAILAAAPPTHPPASRRMHV